MLLCQQAHETLHLGLPFCCSQEDGGAASDWLGLLVGRKLCQYGCMLSLNIWVLFSIQGIKDLFFPVVDLAPTPWDN